VNYTGTTLPPAVITTGVCGGNPVLPIAFLNALAALGPVCASPDCVGCQKQGRKFNDIAGQPGLANWQICAFDSTTKTQVSCATTTAPNGAYSFTFSGATCTTSLTFCEVLQPNFTQTFPTLPSVDPTIVSCQGFVGPGPLGPVGYKETIGVNNTSTGNDFGNTGTTVPGCPENPSAVCTIKVGAGGVPTVQQAYNNASNGAVICIFANTIENVVLGGAKSLTITQCTVGRVTAASNQLPVWTLSSSGKLTVIGADAQNGTIGWLIAGGGGHDVRGVRSTGASQIGIDITSGNNLVSFNAVSGSPRGVRIEGQSNDVRGGTVSGITGNGVEITGNNNSFRTATVRQNSGAGIVVSGTGNTLDANRVNGNTGIGIHINATATGTNLKSNLSGSPENGGAEYQLDTNATDLGNNRADGIWIPSAAKCPTFAAAGTCE